VPAGPGAGAERPCLGIGGDLRRVRPDPADQQWPQVTSPGSNRRQRSTRRPSRSHHPSLRRMPLSSRQLRDALRADRAGDPLVVADAGKLPGEVPGVGAQRHPAAGPCPRRYRGQRAAQQIRHGRAGGASMPEPRSAANTISVLAHAATSGRPAPWLWWLCATPRFLRPQTSTSVASRSIVTGPPTSQHPPRDRRPPLLPA